MQGKHNGMSPLSSFFLISVLWILLNASDFVPFCFKAGLLNLSAIEKMFTLHENAIG